jgi:hypothetical protein
MFPNLDAVTASYYRCRSNEGFIDTFYEHFLAKSQEVSEKFRAGVSKSELETVGDVDVDGKFTNADLQALLNLLKAGGGSTNPVPEPSTLVLAVLAALMVGGLGVRRV